MKIPVIPLLPILAGILGGCASAVPVVDFYDSDSDTLRRFQKITILDNTSANAEDLKNLGVVKGIYCTKNHEQVSVGHHIAKAQAVDQVKLKAAEKGARYITPPHCLISGSSDFTNNCYSTLICSSSAYGASNLLGSE